MTRNTHSSLPMPHITEHVGEPQFVPVNHIKALNLNFAPHITEHVGEPQSFSKLDKLRVNQSLGNIASNSHESIYEGLSREAYEATHDPLTGMLNRRGLERKFKQISELAKYDPDARYTCLLVDLDDFKDTNDMYGHEKGDELLAETAMSLVEEVDFRKNDIVARLGGDEFVVFARIANEGNKNRKHKTEEVAVAGIVKRTKEGALRVGSKLGLGRTSISIGVAMWGRDKTLEEIIREADESMYRDKEQKGAA